MSALGQKQTHAVQQFSALFDHLVGDGQHPWRHLDTKRSRGLQIDDELEFGRLQHRQISGLAPLRILPV